MEIYAVERSLKTLSLKAKILLLIYGVFKVVFFAFLFSIATFLADFYIPDVPRYVRLTFLFSGAICICWLFYKHIIKIILWQPSSSFLAGVVENRFKDLNDTLISAVDFAKKVTKNITNESHQMMIEVIKLAIKNIKDRPMSKIINIRPLLRTYSYGIIAIVFSLYITNTFHDYSKIWFCRLVGGSCKWPAEISLELYSPTPKPGTNIISVGIGDNKRIIAQARGSKIPSRVLLYIVYPDNKQEYFYMTRLLADENKNKFMYELTNINKNFSFYFKSQDIMSITYKVETFPYPTIEKLTYKIYYPPYFPKKTDEFPGGNLQVPIGSNVEVKIKANVPLSYGKIVFESLSENDKDKIQKMFVSGDTTELTGKFLAKQDTDFLLTLYSRETEQITNKENYNFTLKVLQDTPPILRIYYPDKGLKYMTPGGRLLIRIEASDDHGLKRFTRFIKKSDEGKITEYVKKLPLRVGKKVRSMYIYAKKLQAKVGNVLDIDFAVWDNCKFESAELSKKLQCPHKTTTTISSTKRVEIKSVSEFESIIDGKIADLKEKVLSLINIHEAILDQIRKIRGQIQDTMIFDLMFKEQQSIKNTETVRNDLYEIYQDVINNNLYPDNKEIPKKLWQTYLLSLELVDRYPNKGLLYDLSRYIGVLNEPGKISDAKYNLEQVLLRYNGILVILEQWENYQDVVREARKIKEGIKEGKDTLKKIPKN